MVSELDFSNYIASFDISFAHTAKAMQFLRKLPFPECIPNCQFQLSARSTAASTTIMFLVVSNPSMLYWYHDKMAICSLSLDTSISAESSFIAEEY